MNEINVIKVLNKGGMNFVKATDQYSCYDALDDGKKMIAEMKDRTRHYDSCLIERKKFDANKKFCEENDYRFIYVVSMPYEKRKRTYIFEPFKLEKNDYDFKWDKLKCPKTTEFRSRRRVNKRVGFMHIKDASGVVNHT